MNSRSFQEILEEKIKTPRPSFATTSPELDPAGLSFLMGQVPKFHFQVRPRYPRPTTKKPSQQKKREKRPAHFLSELQKKAFEYFLYSSCPLSEDFIFEELRAAFRRLALVLHPDRKGGSTTGFVELKQQ